MTTLEPLLRELIGGALRRRRREHGRTLTDVAGQAGVSMQHLSDVERGRKDASSEILASVADALEVPLSRILREVGDRLAVLEGLSYGELDANRKRRIPKSALGGMEVTVGQMLQAVGRSPYRAVS